MPKFLVVHPIDTPVTLEEGAPVAKAAKANSTVDAYWVNSWAQMNAEGKIVKMRARLDQLELTKLNRARRPFTVH